MSQFRLARLGLILAALGLNFAPAATGMISSAYAAASPAEAARGNALQPAVFKSLQPVQALLSEKKYREALEKIAETDNVPGKTPFDIYTIERMRGIVATAADDTAIAVKAFEAIVDSDLLPAPDQIRFIQSLAELNFRATHYLQSKAWLVRYFRQGGIDPQMRDLLINTHYLTNDFASVVKEIQADLESDQKAGKVPPEKRLQLLFSSAVKAGNQAEYLLALEKLTSFYPKKEYWNDLLGKMMDRPELPERQLLEILRMKLVIVNTLSASEYMNLAELALQAGFPGEASKAIEQGYQLGVLGTGAESARHLRIREKASKAANEDLKTMKEGEAVALKAKDGIGLVNLGYAYVTAGQFDKGIGLMEQGIRTGGLKRAGEAKLHLAVAYAMANKKSLALQTFETVQASDGLANLARYWTMHLKNPLSS